MIQCRKVLRQSAQTKVFLHIQQIKETILYSFWCMSFLNNFHLVLFFIAGSSPSESSGLFFDFFFLGFFLFLEDSSSESEESEFLFLDRFFLGIKNYITVAAFN